MIGINDKVRLKGQDIVMSVLSFQRNDTLPTDPDYYTSMGDNRERVVCGWIGDSAWQTAEFLPSMLEVVPQEVVASPCAVGDVVTLMSSNIRMTVAAVGDVSALCVWFNPDNLLQERQFPFDTLAFAQS